MDWIGHHNDIAHWSMDLDQSGPSLVEAVDWTRPKTDVYNTPHQYTIRCEFPNGISFTISSGNEQGTKWIGENGWFHVKRAGMKASDKSWANLKFKIPGDFRVPVVKNHIANFIDCVISREQPLAPAETAHRSITPGHLGYVSYQLGRPLKWDATNEIVSNDSEANELLQQATQRAAT